MLLLALRLTKITIFSAPKKTLEKVDNVHVRDNNQPCTTKEGSKDQTSQKTTDNDQNVPKKISGGLDSEITENCSVSQTNTDEMKRAGREPCHLIKEEKEEIEVSTTRSIGEMPDITLKVEEVEIEGNTMYSCIATHVKSMPCNGNEIKRANSTSDQSQDDRGSQEKMGIEMRCKRQWCISEQDASQSLKVPSDGLKRMTTTDNGWSGTSCHKTIKKEGILICRWCHNSFF